MGLDMFLYRKSYVRNWDHQDVKHNVKVEYGGKERKDIDPKKISGVTEQVGYWRKANQIHKWFVDNCQDGRDDCKEYHVDLDQLKELLEICKTINKNPEKANELLPCQSGFFFGGTEYDEWYMQDIDDTIGIIADILDNESNTPKGCWINYYYQSSW